MLRHAIERGLPLLLQERRQLEEARRNGLDVPTPRPSAELSSFVCSFRRGHKMGFMGAAVNRAHTRGEFGHVQQAIGFHDLALGMKPRRLDRIEPGALDRQGTDNQAHAAAALLDLMIVPPQPGTDELGVVPGGVVPHQQHGALAARRGLCGAPRQDVDRDGADRPAVDEAQPEFLGTAPVSVPGAGQEPIAGHRFGVGVVARDRLRDQPQGPALILPGMEGRMGQATPPHLVLDAEHPVRMGLGHPDQTVAPRFFSGILRVGASDPLFGAPPAHAHARQGVADGHPAHTRGGQALRVGDRSGQVQRPQARVVAEGAGALMEQGAQRLGAGGVEGAHDDTRMVRAGPQDVQPARIKRMDHGAHTLRREADARGDLSAALPGGARQHDLSTAQDKGIGRTQIVPQYLALRVRQRTHKEGSGSTHTSSIPHCKQTTLRRH